MKFPTLQDIKDAFSAAGQAISAAATKTGHFLRKHWAATAAVVIGFVAFAAVTTALVFLWPAAIGAAAGLAITLPIIGTVAPLAFLSTLSIPAAAAVLGAFAFGATMLASAAINGFAAIYNAINDSATRNLPENLPPHAEEFEKVGDMNGSPFWQLRRRGDETLQVDEGYQILRTEPQYQDVDSFNLLNTRRPGSSGQPDLSVPLQHLSQEEENVPHVSSSSSSSSH